MEAYQPDHLHLLTLPAEIRLNLYRIMFGVPFDMPLALRRDGCIEKMLSMPRPNLSLHFLRVCRQIYTEAVPVLYGSNRFRVDAAIIPSLRVFKQSSRMCIETVKVRCHRDKFVDFAALGEALPYLQTVDVNCMGPVEFLLITCALTTSLPCSPIRAWPRLEIHVTVPGNHEHLKQLRQQLATVSGWTTKADKLDRLKKALNQQPLKLSNLERETNGRALGLGREMPEFALIRVYGKLPPEFSRAVGEHRSSFGDCGFEKTVFVYGNGKDKAAAKSDTTSRSDDDDNDDDASDDSRESTGRIKYTWRKEGTLHDATALKDPRLLAADDSEGMHQWVPRLPKEFYEAVLEAGLVPRKEVGKEVELA